MTCLLRTGVLYMNPCTWSASPTAIPPPAVLLRESVREGSKIRKRTLANLSDWPQPQVDSLRRLLKGETLVSPQDALLITRSLPHGHVASVLGTLRSLGIEQLLSGSAGRQRDLVCAMIVARILQPSSKLAMARGLDLDTASSSLGELLDLSRADEDDLYEAMDWLLPQQSAIESPLASQICPTARWCSTISLPVTSKGGIAHWLSSDTRAMSDPATRKSSTVC